MSGAAATTLARRRPDPTWLFAGIGLGAAVALRGALGGPDPASSGVATCVFVTALTALALAGGVRVRRPPVLALAMGVLGGLVLAGGSLLARPGIAVHVHAPASGLMAWSALIVLIAVTEEAVMRGVLFGALTERWGSAIALGVTSAVFALMHLPMYGLAAMPLDFAVGLWLGGLRLLSGGIAAPAAAHAVADLFAGWVG